MSREKAKIFFSKNVNHSKAREIAEDFGFSLTGDLGKYLGVPLQHKCSSSKFFRHLTDKLM